MSKITALYYANSFVDAVQDAKNKFVDTFVTDEKVKAPLKEFVEAQRTFTKQINRSIDEVAQYAIVATQEAIAKK
jgi:3-oxoacyl-(acyl-carrier-protein) synthase